MLNKRAVDLTLRDHIIINMVVLAPIVCWWCYAALKDKVNASKAKQTD